MKRTLIAGAIFVGIGGLLAIVGLGVLERPSSSRLEASASSRLQEGPPDLRVRVHNRQGEPIEGATVDVDRYKLPTDAEGLSAFYRLEPGSHRIDIEADGYVVPGPDSTRYVTVDLPPESRRDGPVDVDVTLRRSVHLAGRVVAEEQPVSEAEITLRYRYADGLTGPLDPFTSKRVATTDERGRFELEVAPGRLELVATHDDHRSRAVRPLYLEPGQRMEQLVLDIAPSGALTGRVTDTKGSPIRAEIVLQPHSTRGNEHRVETHGEGTYHIDGLTSGRYDLIVRARGYRTNILEEIRVNEEPPTTRDISLVGASGVFGRVLGPEGEGISDVMVRISRDGSTAEWIQTGEGGQFEWPGAPRRRASWQIRAISARHAPSSTVTAERGVSATLRLGPSGAITGRVVDTSGRPVSSYTIGIGTVQVSGPRPYRGSQLERKTIQSDSGRFTYGPLRPGRYQLRIRADGYAPTASRLIRVEPRQTTEDVTLELGRGGIVQGTVRSENGEPLAGASLEVYSMTSPFRPPRTRTDADGHYTLTRVPSGRQSLRIAHDGHLTRIVSGMQVPEGGRVTRDISLAPSKQGKDFSFQGIGAVLRKTDRGIVIRDLIDEGGAARQGLKRGDIIEAVDRESVQTWPLSKVIKTIRGRRGEPVTLRIRRDARSFNVTIRRGRVDVDR